MRRTLLLLLALLLAAGSAWSAVTCEIKSGSTARYTCTAVSDASGDATGTFAMRGYVVRMTTNPDGTAAPTADYDCYLYDPDGIDVLGGALVNRSATASEQAYPLDATGAVVWPYALGQHALTCANMGNVTQSVITLFVKE